MTTETCLWWWAIIGHLCISHYETNQTTRKLLCCNYLESGPIVTWIQWLISRNLIKFMTDLKHHDHRVCNHNVPMHGIDAKGARLEEHLRAKLWRLIAIYLRKYACRLQLQLRGSTALNNDKLSLPIAHIMNVYFGSLTWQEMQHDRRSGRPAT